MERSDIRGGWCGYLGCSRISLALNAGYKGWSTLLRRERVLAARELEAVPHVEQRFRQAIDQRVVVIGRRRDAQPLGALWHGRVVDRLNVDAVLLEQEVGRLLALLRVADEHRHDVSVVGHHRQ